MANFRKAPFLLEPFDPAAIGQRRIIRYGVGSGRATLEEKLKEMNLTVPEIHLLDLQRQLDQKVRAKKNTLSDEEIREIVSSLGK